MLRMLFFRGVENVADGPTDGLTWVGQKGEKNNDILLTEKENWYKKALCGTTMVY